MQAKHRWAVKGRLPHHIPWRKVFDHVRICGIRNKNFKLSIFSIICEHHYAYIQEYVHVIKKLMIILNYSIRARTLHLIVKCVCVWIYLVVASIQGLSCTCVILSPYFYLFSLCFSCYTFFAIITSSFSSFQVFVLLWRELYFFVV